MQIDILDAGHGDCLLITCNDTLILIDAGPKALKIRRALIERIITLLDGRTIDVAIVTHNDDDHIGGFKYLIDSGVEIKSFIFNSIDLIPDIIKQSRKTKKISFRQDKQLYAFLNDKSIDVRTLQLEDIQFELNDIKFIPLTPNYSILEKLNKAVEKKTKKISGKKVAEYSVADCIEEIESGNDCFVEDTSITNKSSISFILEFDGKRALFLGDSHPSDVISAVKVRQFDNLCFDLVKLSHHASSKNSSRELIELLGITEYILCADKSTRHGHPNNKTICRILSFNPNAVFHLSANNDQVNNVFKECVDLGYSVTTTLPSQGVNRIVL